MTKGQKFKWAAIGFMVALMTVAIGRMMDGA